MRDLVTVDLNHVVPTQVGPGGLSKEDFEGAAPALKQALEALLAQHDKGALRFLSLPDDAAAAEATRAAAAALARDNEDLVVLGIGGSSLGAKALVAALCHPFHNLLPADRRKGMRVFFPDNSDPATFAALLEVAREGKTAFAAITKSGGTAETWVQLLLVLDRMKDKARGKVLAVTDPKKGALRAVATKEGWPTLPVPPEVGGRFSVLTAVGLLPAAAAGLDVPALLGGAAAMAERCRSLDVLQNPAAMLAQALHLFDTRKGRRLHVFMPYADALRETGDWFVQLWAESLGKRRGQGFVGPTPIRAVGATDQHSLLQLLMEGPQDKVVVFVEVGSPRFELTIPGGFSSEPDVTYLAGHTMHGLLSAELFATRAALAAQGRPSVTIRLPRIDARSMGELLMLLEAATGIAGPLYGVDPYDQPGVEAGKRYTCGLLGRPGYEASRAELDARPATRGEWVL